MLRHHITNLNHRVLQYQENDTVNAQSDTVNDNDDTVTGLKKSLQKVYNVILNNPEITHSEIMETLHISESTAKQQPETLKSLATLQERALTKQASG